MGLSLIALAFPSLKFLLAVLLVVVGLGMVIFVHELGHFLVAKACGVKCEKFYLGFDVGGWKLAKFQWGETEYGIGALPLGGYVKMLGQEDNPARLREEVERAKQHAADAAPAGGDAAPAGNAAQPMLSAEELLQAEQILYNPRSYLAKSVPQRMAIISAGVIMNILFAFVAAAVAYSLGVEQPTCAVGEVSPGSPAWQAGLHTGDQIIEIGGRPTHTFMDLMAGIQLGNADAAGIPLVVRRPGVAEPLKLTVHPEERHGQPTIGIGRLSSLQLATHVAPAWPGSAAAAAQPPLEKGDRIVAVDGQKVAGVVDLNRILVARVDQPIELTVQRDPPAGAAPGTGPTEVKIKVPPNPMRRLGLVMEIGEITAVQHGSPAEKAGLKRGDRIQTIDGNPPVDPVTLPQWLSQRAGQTIHLAVVREGGKQPLEMDVELRKVDWYERTFLEGGPMPAPALGATYKVLNRIRDTRADAPAAKAGVHAGDVIAQANILPPDVVPKEAEDFKVKVQLDFKQEQPNFPFFFSELQEIMPGSRVQLALEPKRNVELIPEQEKDWFNPDRGFVFDAQMFRQVAGDWREAIALGAAETKDATLMVVSVLRRLGTRISVRNLHGPIDIVGIAIDAAQAGVSRLLLFLTMISANLAVINFLPIPVLDGGHMVFLAWEGLWGKPLSERVQLALTYAGLLFILGLMLFVVSLDLHLIPRP